MRCFPLPAFSIFPWSSMVWLWCVWVWISEFILLGVCWTFPVRGFMFSSVWKYSAVSPSDTPALLSPVETPGTAVCAQGCLAGLWGSAAEFVFGSLSWLKSLYSYFIFGETSFSHFALYKVPWFWEHIWNSCLSFSVCLVSSTSALPL